VSFLSEKGRALIAVRAENVRLETPKNEDALVLEAVLEASTYRGLYTEHRVRLSDGQSLSAIEQRQRDLAPGSRIRISISPDDVIALDPD
jgi:hypothetical protein